MTKVRLLTVPQKNELVGQTYCTNSFFNPIQDINNNWIISNEEVCHCENAELDWVADLPEIEYLPKPYPPIEP
jgi:hypothetical protein